MKLQVKLRVKPNAMPVAKLNVKSNAMLIAKLKAKQSAPLARVEEVNVTVVAVVQEGLAVHSKVMAKCTTTLWLVMVKCANPL